MLVVVAGGICWGVCRKRGASCFCFVFLLQYKLQQEHVADGPAGAQKITKFAAPPEKATKANDANKQTMPREPEAAVKRL